MRVDLGAFSSLLILAYAVYLGIQGIRTRNGNVQAGAIIALQAELKVLQAANHRLDVELGALRGERDQLLKRLDDLTNLALARPEWSQLMDALKASNDLQATLLRGVTAVEVVAAQAPGFYAQQAEQHAGMLSLLASLRDRAA